MALSSQDRIDLRLGTDGDLELAADGDLQFSSGIAGVGQSAQFSVLLAEGECFFDMDAGMPWYEGNGVERADAILGSKFDQRRVPPLTARELLQAPGVAAVTTNTAELDNTTRKLKITFSVKAEFGDILSDDIEVNV